MRLIRRRHGSQRTLKDEKEVLLLPRFSGMGDDVNLTMKIGDIWHTFVFEDEDEIKAMMSAIHVVHYNWQERYR